MDNVFLIILLVQLVAVYEMESLQCSSDSQMCRDNSRCVVNSTVCDGVPNCDDGSDEEGCDPVFQPKTINNPTVPLSVEIPGGMTPGRVIYLVGIPKSDAIRFQIGLSCGLFCRPMNMPFYIDVRFEFQGYNNIVVFNSIEQGVWGIEELKHDFPFAPNDRYEIKILCEPWSFKISVNSQHFAEFFHRIEPEKATHIGIVDNTSLIQVRFEEKRFPLKYDSSWFQGPNRKLYIDLHEPNQNKENSRELCEDVGGYIPRPKNREENDFLKNLEENFYIGVNDIKTEGSWVFDDDALTECHWTHLGIKCESVGWFDWIARDHGYKEPDGRRTQNCVSLWRDHKQRTGWIDISCTRVDQRHITTVVCEKKDSSWFQGPNGKLYVDLRKPNQNKENSRELCEDVGGYLPKPENQEENDFLKTFEENFYIGINDISSEGSWVFDDDATSVEWTDWIARDHGYTEPDGRRTQNCVSLWRDYKKRTGWIDISCTRVDKYHITTVVCEKKENEGCGHSKQRCADDIQCVWEWDVCNGVTGDCDDDSDEERCESHTCASGLRKCNNNRQCVWNYQFCDGHKHCSDESDEEGCEKYNCGLGKRKCKDKRQCVDRDVDCDGVSHCDDGSDEQGCESHDCPTGQQKCKDKRQCVLSDHICDGYPNCDGGSDEDGCLNKQCPSGQQKCLNRDQCVWKYNICDGGEDCNDGSDEQGCEYYGCGDGKKRCKDNLHCVWLKEICDGISQCLDKSDEAGCDNQNCALGKRKCKNNLTCVWDHDFCDGHKHCDDGSDEEGCAEVKTFFEKFDKDKNGLIERDEMVQAIMDKITDSLAEAEQATDSTFERHDLDKDGKLNKIEIRPSLS